MKRQVVRILTLLAVAGGLSLGAAASACGGITAPKFDTEGCEGDDGVTNPIDCPPGDGDPQT